MKKLFGIILALVLCLSLVSITAFAADPTAVLSGPDTVRAGQTITLDYKLTGENIVAAMGTLQYDPNQLTLVSAEQQVGSSWLLTPNGNTYMVEDNSLSAPVNGEATLIRFTFKVAELAEGTQISVSFTGVTATSLSAESAVADVSYAATISRPLGTNDNLASLTVGNATLSPAFDPSLTRYTVEVPFEISTLDVSAAPADGNATVSIDNPVLVEDRTTIVTITVRAENGSTKDYIIQAKRGKDPNYVPSDNNLLSDIVVEEFRLSPVFSSEITNYLIWLPYEVDSVKIIGISAHKYATIMVEGGSNLVAGADNEIKITCTAENGEARVYTIIAKRAPAHEDMTKPTTPSTAPSTSPSTMPSAYTTAPNSQQSTRPTNTPQDNENEAQKLMIILYCILGAIAVAGIAICVLIILANKKQGKFTNKK